MSDRTRRRRGLLLLSLALASGGLAASQVRDKVGQIEARVGSPEPVLVARRDIRPDARIAARDVVVREVPRRFAPPDRMASPADVVGLRAVVGVPAGGYVSVGAVESGEGGRGGSLRAGERALELSVTGGMALEQGAAPGSRVDVLVSTQGRSFLALQDAELLAVGPGGESEAAAGEDGARGNIAATLRVSLRQAVYLTAAQNFAREIRLLPRPPGDRRRAGQSAVSAGEL